MENEEYKDLHSPSTVAPSVVFDSIVLKAISHISYQDPDKIKEGLSYIWDETHKWQVLSHSMGMNEKDLKTQLKNIILRRNQIVHEMDVDLLNGNPQSISYADTLAIVDFIKSLGYQIYNKVL